MDQQSYIRHADSDERRQVLRDQWKEAHRNNVITCGGCGLKRDLMVAYKCLYCGVWFCAGCGEIHFGKTIKRHFLERLPADYQI